DPSTGKELRRALEWNGARTALALSADGKRFFTGHTAEPTLYVGDAQTGRVLKALEGHAQGVVSVGLSSDGKLGASNGVDRTLRLWDLTAGKELRRFKAVAAPADGIALSPDGKRLASGHQPPDNRVRVWDTATGEVVRELAGHTGRVRVVR